MVWVHNEQLTCAELLSLESEQLNDSPDNHRSVHLSAEKGREHSLARLATLSKCSRNLLQKHSSGEGAGGSALADSPAPSLQTIYIILY